MAETRERATVRWEVGPASEIPPGGRTIVYPHGGTGIGVFNVDGNFYAVKNTCPHMGAPLCVGRLTGTTIPLRTPDGQVGMEWVRDGEILRCPWHHWEFDIATGKTLFPSRQRVATYKVALEPNGEVPSVETYPVVIEDATVYLVLNAR
jgi:nitrite reductase/ring-hydroxylating ferredoxin subunit